MPKREPIKDGEVRPSKGGVAFVLGIWQDGDEIGLNVEEIFKSSVNDKDGSIRQHKNLYKHLKKILQDHGKWKE